jgi:hypothetical protein
VDRRKPTIRRTTTSTLHDPKDYSSYEGVLEPEGPGVWFDPEVGSDPRWQKRWKSTERVKLLLTSTRIVLLRLGCIAECLNDFEYLIQSSHGRWVPPSALFG